MAARWRCAVGAGFDSPPAPCGAVRGATQMQEPYDQYAGAVKRAFNRLDEVKWVSLHDVPADEMPPILVRQIGEDPTDAVRETTERFSVDIVDVERETVAAGECQIFVSL